MTGSLISPRLDRALRATFLVIMIVETAMPLAGGRQTEACESLKANNNVGTTDKMAAVETAMEVVDVMEVVAVDAAEAVLSVVGAMAADVRDPRAKAQSSLSSLLSSSFPSPEALPVLLSLSLPFLLVNFVLFR